MNSIKIAAALLAASCLSSAGASVTFAPAFGDHMVLQRGRPVAVWGRADPGAEVAVAFAGRAVRGRAAADGAWSVELAPLDASKEGRELTAAAGGGTAAVKDVVVGEVWFCAGQSNMQLPLWGDSPRFRDAKGALVAQLAADPLLRFVRVPQHQAKAPARTCAVAWERADPTNVLPLSAVAYYYGATLRRALDVPVGLVVAAWGGTRIELWTPACGFAAAPELADAAAVAASSRAWPGRKDSACNLPTLLARRSAIYNGMLAPFAPFAARGFIWYQGEANRADGPIYGARMKALYAGLAEEFRNPALPFYFAQLAPFVHNDDPPSMLATLWEAQQRFAADEPHAGMAVINDIGNLHDVHPAEKETVALRLAFLALARDYGLPVKADSPVLAKADWRPDGVLLSFAHATRFYSTKGEPVRNFELAGADGKFAAAKAELRGADIFVSAPGVSSPRSVRYMWNAGAEGNLYNEVCLPPGAFHASK